MGLDALFAKLIIPSWLSTVNRKKFHLVQLAGVTAPPICHCGLVTLSSCTPDQVLTVVDNPCLLQVLVWKFIELLHSSNVTAEELATILLTPIPSGWLLSILLTNLSTPSNPL